MSAKNGPSFHAEAREIYHAGRMKTYPGGAWEIMAASRPIFREPGWEDAKEARPLAAIRQSEAEPEAAREEAAEAADEGSKAANQERAARRAAAKVRDLALSNPFKWFVTLTLDPAKVDRYDVKEITKKLNNWLDHQVQRRGAAYVIIPERHKDGALHFHGLVTDCGGFVPSGTWKVPGAKKPKRPRSKAEAARWAAAGAAEGFHEVYNWNAWTLGFSTAIALWGDYDAAVSYVCKYIRKQTGPGGKIGGRWYYSGGALLLPDVSYVDLGLPELKATGASCYTFSIPEIGVAVGITRGKSGHEKLSLQKPECQIAPETQPQRGPEARESGGAACAKVSQKEDFLENGIPVKPGSGPRSGGPYAGKSSCCPSEFTHGAANRRRSRAENGAAQAAVLGD